MATTHLGLPATAFAAPAGFLAWNWFYAYCILSSRTIKQIYGLDHNGSPRQDLNKYGDAAVRDGKISKARLEQIQRLEAASANSVDGFTLFVCSVLMAVMSGVPNSTVNRACATYTVARLVYGAVYTFTGDDLWSQMRGISWWTGNISCLFLLWKSAKPV